MYLYIGVNAGGRVAASPRECLRLQEGFNVPEQEGVLAVHVSEQSEQSERGGYEEGECDPKFVYVVVLPKKFSCVSQQSTCHMQQST